MHINIIFSAITTYPVSPDCLRIKSQNLVCSCPLRCPTKKDNMKENLSIVKISMSPMDLSRGSVTITVFFLTNKTGTTLEYGPFTNLTVPCTEYTTQTI